jgi:hypothetical protein
VPALLESEAETFVRAQLGEQRARLLRRSMRLGVRSRLGALAARPYAARHRPYRHHGARARAAHDDQRRRSDRAAENTDGGRAAYASVDECCAAAAAAMRAATGFDRAMVYRFLPDGSGVVAAEDASAGLELFLGLHYPASDIPKQARELYRRNWLRAIPNINYIAAPLAPTNESAHG